MSKFSEKYYRKFLKFCYYYARYLGLISVKYNVDKECFCESSLGFSYALIATISNTVALPLSIYIYFSTRKHTFSDLIWMFQIIFNYFVIVFVFINQLFQTKNLLNLLNLALKINKIFQNFKKVTHFKKTPILYLLAKFLIVDSTVGGFLISNSVNVVNGTGDYFLGFCTFYFSMTPMAVMLITNGFFIGFLRIITYFEIINEELLKLVNRINPSSDDVDNISIVYHRLCYFLKCLIQLSTFPVLFSITNCYINILVMVNLVWILFLHVCDVCYFYYLM